MKVKETHFYFNYQKKSRSGSNNINSIDYMEPYIYEWNGTREHLISHSRYGCRKDNPYNNYCAKLIQESGWKIPKDYPW